ncbi:unnamed protein product [Didymodactylos carnosus]|uniref:Uncharacterized protein n=1 Tax=Didymodactylos carnosus TaxID=1234261 RepID=A0A8S2GZ62_9BILA|nr:unnamed protein product [Didymodactylos carnosus]CAF3575371.1 unnamed protein product [Didymodactylos carnosus]
MGSNTKNYKGLKEHKRCEREYIERKVAREDAPPPSVQGCSANSGDTERSSLSFSETNKLRAQLGMKPLTKLNEEPSKQQGENIIYNGEDVFTHRPAISLTEKKHTQQIKDKLSLHKEKRQLEEKFLSTKSLSIADSDELTSAWIEKMRRVDIEKRKAVERANLPEKMDEEFGLGELVKEETEKLIKTKEKKYTSKDLTGLRIEHSADTFKEGQQIILTLKDQSIIREKKPGEPDMLEDDDVLVNVNTDDDERTVKKTEDRKQKSGHYCAYKDEDNDVDNFGMPTESRLLDQYDEKKKSSFQLESGGIYDLSDENIMNGMRQEFHSRMHSRNEFYTQYELEQFRKPKKVIKKKLRTRKVLKPDDLLAMDIAAAVSRHHHGNIGTTESLTTTTTKEIIARQKNRTNRLIIDDLKREDTDLMDSDLIDPYDLSNVVLEDDTFKELQDAVNKTIKLKTKGTHALSELIEERDRKLTMNIKEEPTKVSTVEISIKDKQQGLILDTMSEFCRTLGEDAAIVVSSTKPTTAPLNLLAQHFVLDTKFNRPTITRSRIKRTHRQATVLDHDDELLEYAMATEQDDDDNNNNNSRMNGDEDNSIKSIIPFRFEDLVLDEVPGLDRGLANALRLVKQKGYLEKDKGRQNACITSEISTKHSIIEEKNDYDIDDKFSRRECCSGFLTDFKEKEAYRPDVELEYPDDAGRRMNSQEAFRYLSRRFHGKYSGKKKTEKRTKKLIEEELVKKMSSVDTPLNTVALFQQKQTQLQQSYVVLNLMTDTVVTNNDNINDGISLEENAQILFNNELTSVITAEINKCQIAKNEDDEWKSMDDKKDDETEEKTNEISNKNFFPDEDNSPSNNWANFASFKTDNNNINQECETSFTKEENDEGWEYFEYNITPIVTDLPATINSTLTKNGNDEEYESGKFNEGHISAELNSFVEQESKTKTLSLPICDPSCNINDIESIIQTCFLFPSSSSSTIEYCEYSELPTFINNKNSTLSSLKPCLNVWNVLSDVSNDPYGLKFQWRKSNSEQFFHQALGVNERYTTKTTSLTPTILRPEEITSTIMNDNVYGQLENENEPSSTLNSHFDWKEGSLKNSPTVFDANKILDIDYLHPSKMSDLMSSTNVQESSISLSTSSPTTNEHACSTKTTVPLIKTIGLFPGSSFSPTTPTKINTNNVKHILKSLPNLSFMSAKSLMFNVQLNGGNDETTSLY